MDEVRVNLKEEFERKRSAKITDESVEKRMFCKDNRKVVETFIENHVITSLRVLRKWHSMARLFCITFYVIDQSELYYVVYNTNTSVGLTGRESTCKVSKKTLQLANEIASEYGIEAISFIEDSYDAFRFQILI